MRRLRPGARNVQRHGDPAVGVVVDARSRLGGRQALTILARVPGGDRTIVRTVATGGPLGAGDHVPLRYARHDPSRIEVDADALRAGPQDGAGGSSRSSPGSTGR